MLLFDATHTSHTSAQTGIQRVCRSLYRELVAAQKLQGVCYDPYLRSWRPLHSAEAEIMQPGRRAAGSRGAKWPLHQRLAGRARRLLGGTGEVPQGGGLIVPELFSREVGQRLPELFARAKGPRVAIFYDGIPLKFPELTPPGTVARLPAYLRELLQFDGVAAISADSAQSLRDYWQWLGVENPPPVQAIPLGVDPKNISTLPNLAPTNSGLPRVLSVGTLEGRKNHLALLEAAEALWRDGLKFELQIIGLARPDTAWPAIEKMAVLQKAGRPLLHDGGATDAELQIAYQQCSFTVYPSLIEGFGLPVIESLQHGRPCVCSARGALAESAEGGGCVMLDTMDAASIAGALRNLVTHPTQLIALEAEARRRIFRSWGNYAADMTDWMATLVRR